MRKISLMAIWLMAACTPSPTAQVSKNRPVIATSGGPVATQQTVAAVPVVQSRRTSGQMALDFTDLSFNMESGRALPHFSRFEGPITLALTGNVPASAQDDLQRLITRFRYEAGLPVSLAQPGTQASITIEFSPRSALRQIAPSAACFVVPNVSSLAEYASKRGTVAADWAYVTERSRVAIFVPSDTSPQEVRDCLHEEVAQAMGPLNDLYRLPDSVFNDDNFVTVLTSFDMTILRMYYDPALYSGMTRAQVADRIGAIAAKHAPAGPARSAGSVTPKVWSQAIETALGGNAGHGTRVAAAERALATARAQGWNDNRLAFSHFALARLYVAIDPLRAVKEFTAAARLYRSLPGGHIHVAHIDMQLAAIAVAKGQPNEAIQFANRALPVIERAQNAALLATVMLIKAEAYDLLGQSQEADALRLDSRAWARYGFGSDAATQSRMREISALGSRGRRS